MGNICDKMAVGYKGQRYRVVITVNGVKQVQGWTDDPSGGTLMGMCKLHPTWKHMNPRVEAVPQVERERWLAQQAKKA
jgi:hypothetical protein